MRFIWLPVAFVCLACDGRVLNVGGDGGGVGPADASSDGVAQADATLPDDATVLADGAVVVPPGGMRLGDFTGYFEDYMFPSGSDAVTMNLVVAADGATVTGVVVFGMGSPPAPPTDPSVGYPPGYQESSSSSGSGTGPQSVFEGYVYTGLGGTLGAGRLKLGVDNAEPYGAWCALEKSYPQGDGTYKCVPGGACGTQSGAGPLGTCGIKPCLDGGGEGPLEAIDCGRANLCGLMGLGQCACTATGCARPTVATINFDMQLTPMHLDGSTAGLPTVPGNINVHLTEQ